MKNIVDYITVVINVKNGYYIKIKALCNGYSMEKMALEMDLLDIMNTFMIYLNCRC